MPIEGDTIQLTEDEVIELYQSLLWSSNITVVTKQYALMSITKLSTRFTSVTPKIQQAGLLLLDDRRIGKLLILP